MMKNCTGLVISFACIAFMAVNSANSATLEKIPNTSYSKYCDYGMCALYDNFENTNVTNLIYRDIAYLNDTHYCKVLLNGKWGIFDLYTEKEITPIMYDDVASIKMNGGHYLAVKQDGKWAIFYADKAAELTDFIYENLMPYEEEGLYKVKTADNKTGFILLPKFSKSKMDLNLIPAVFDDAEPLIRKESELYTTFGTLYKVEQSGKWAVYDTDSKQLRTEYVYDDIRKFENGEIKGRKGDSWKNINLK